MMQALAIAASIWLSVGFPAALATDEPADILVWPFSFGIMLYRGCARRLRRLWRDGR